MKRRGYVVEKIADIDNLREAFVKARRGKAAKKEVVSFSKKLNEELLKLREGILHGTIETGDYNYFTIYDPKQRLICTAPFVQRVLHHAIMNVCHEDFEHRQTSDSYASRIGRGVYAALDKAYNNQCRFRYWLKLDVRKYFDSISHDHLMFQLGRIYKDPLLLGMFRAIIGSYCTEPGRGLPIGNLTSQYFANHYLSPLDHYIREGLHVEGYVRYMDDMMLWGDDKMALLTTGRRVREFLENKLGLTLKVFQLHATEVSVTFLGYRMKHGSRTLSVRSAVRYRRNLRKLYAMFDGDTLTDEDMRVRLSAVLAFVRKVPSDGVRRKAMQECLA